MPEKAFLRQNNRNLDLKLEPLTEGMVRPTDEETIAIEKTAHFSQFSKGVGMLYHQVPTITPSH